MDGFSTSRVMPECFVRSVRLRQSSNSVSYTAPGWTPCKTREQREKNKTHGGGVFARCGGGGGEGAGNKTNPGGFCIRNWLPVSCKTNKKQTKKAKKVPVYVESTPTWTLRLMLLVCKKGEQRFFLSFFFSLMRGPLNCCCCCCMLQILLLLLLHWGEACTHHSGCFVRKAKPLRGTVFMGLFLTRCTGRNYIYTKAPFV